MNTYLVKVTATFSHYTELNAANQGEAERLALKDFHAGKEMERGEPQYEAEAECIASEPVIRRASK